MTIKMKPKSFLRAVKTELIDTDNIDTVEDKIYNGVYLIENTINNKKYVGSSSDVVKRIKTHKQHLKKGCHNCRKLQKDYDEHGLDKFKFTIIEKNIPEHLLTAYEKYYIYIHDAIVMYKGYNEKFPTLNHKLFKEVCELKNQNKKG